MAMAFFRNYHVRITPLFRGISEILKKIFFHSRIKTLSKKNVENYTRERVTTKKLNFNQKKKTTIDPINL